MPQMLDNENDKAAAVNGIFVYQRKGLKGEWEDWSEQKLSELKSGEGISLPLHSAELKILHQYVTELFRVHKELGGIVSAEFELTPANASAALRYFLKSEGEDIVLEKLEELGIDDVQKLNSLTRIANLKKVLASWEENKANGDEEYWQKFLAENSWVISQLVSYPVFVMNEKAYVGGKGMDNKGGKVVDFLIQNDLTKNAALLEIKTPQTPLLSKTEYREGVYPLSSELSGAIAQALSYRHRYLVEFQSLAASDGRPVYAFNPKALVVAGNLGDQILSPEQIESFELHRQQLKDVEVVTFDELFHRAKRLVDLLCGDSSVGPAVRSAPSEILPF